MSGVVGVLELELEWVTDGPFKNFHKNIEGFRRDYSYLFSSIFVFLGRIRA
jgi:hypothetical protein